LKPLTLAGRTIAVPLILAATTSLAWGQNRRTTSLEEVVVYARKINENQQTVPISMVVNSGEQLEAAQVVDFQDITKITPGLTITSDDPTSSSIKIRGVGLSFFGLAADPGVVITVDEFPQSRIGSVFGAFLDVRQVEVLKGPQGTLYGRNAPSGVISIWSNRPDFEGIHGRAQLSSSTYDTLLGEAAINLPVIDDKLAVRLAYIHNESDGFNDLAKYDRVSTGEDTHNYIYAGQKVHADEVDGDDGIGGDHGGALDDIEADAADTDDDDGLADLDGGVVVNDTEGGGDGTAEEGGEGEVEIFRDDGDAIFGDNGVAVKGGDPAGVYGFAISRVFGRIALESGAGAPMEDDVIAGGDGFDAIADGEDFAGAFVTEEVGEPAVFAFDAVDFADLAAADAAVGEFDEDLAEVEFRGEIDGIDDEGFPLFDEDGGFGCFWQAHFTRRK
jgi:outer membrane receptor protein involved in Fe transport